MNLADRITTTFLALLTAASGLVGYNAIHTDPITHPIRWAADSPLVLDSTSPLVDEGLAALSAWDSAITMPISTALEGNIHIRFVDPEGKVGGEARKVVQDRWIIGCYIDIASNTQEDLLLPILTHELGHCLGLDHDMTKEPSIMYFDMAGWETDLFSFDMTDHDLTSLRRLYSL